ncbi:MAG: PAS domain S-box protein [Syntrophobacter sp.]
MVKELYAQEMILAKQAAKGIETLFDHYWISLSLLSKNAHIIDMDKDGEELLDSFFNHNSTAIRSITRVGLHGDILYTYPFKKMIGTSLSSQDHIRSVYQLHRTVLSPTFMSVQGLEAAAFHIPVFKSGEYFGSLGILLDYDSIAETYFHDVRVGKEGFVWVISQQGVELASPDRNHIGKLGANSHKDSPLVLSLIKLMLTGQEGTFEFTGGYNNNDPSHDGIMYAAYHPVRLFDTFWSICVMAPDSQVLSHIQGFKNRCIAILLILAGIGLCFSFYLFRFHVLRAEQAARDQTEEVLRKSESRLKIILESIPAGMIVVDRETRSILDVNRAAADIIRAPAEDIVGKVCLRYICPTPEEHCPVSELSPMADHAECQLFTHDGEPICVLKTVVPIELSGRAVLLECFLDITERKKSEVALRESEERYRRLFEMESDAILLVDVDTGQIMDANPAAAELYGYSIVELMELSALDVSAEPEKTSLALREARIQVPLRYHRRKGGTTFPVEIRGRRSDWGGKIVQLFAIRDISERLQAEEERYKLESQLRHSQKMEAIGTLAGGIAHDFNNILAAIVGYTELCIQDAPRGNGMATNLRHVLKASFRARELVKQILSFSRKVGEQERSPVDLVPLLKEAIKLIRASLPTTIQIRQDIASTPMMALADSTQIHQVLINLCTNAAHAMEDSGGVLEVGIHSFLVDETTAAHYHDLKPGSYIRLSVSDTGCGMDKATMERIFDPYFTTKGVGKGSGLGLAGVHGIVKSHEGAVRVYSEPGKGSVFHVFIPASEGEAQAGSGTSEEIRRGTERILLVDDEEDIQDLTQKLLERLGYQVLAFTNPVEALEHFRKNPEQFDLIITDYTMPHITGEKLAGQCLSACPTIPVLLCTGFSERMDESKAKELGVQEFLLKPLSLRELGDAVRRAIDSRHSLQSSSSRNGV